MPRFGPKIFQYAEPALILYVFALSMHVQTLNQYVYYRISKEKGFPDNYTGHQTDCVKLNATLKELQKEVQETASYFTIGFNLCNAVPSIIICLFLGVWSDISGRKIIIGLSLFGSILEYVTVIVTMYTDWPIYVIFAGSFLNGLGGYYIGIQFAVMAYIADTSDKDKRAVRLGNICKIIKSLIDNIFVQCGGRPFRQVIGIPMGTNCAPLLADLFLYSYENEFLDNMIRSGHRGLARSFNLCYRYTEDMIVFRNKKFLDYLKEINPSQLTVEKASKSDQLAHYLDLTFIIDSGGIMEGVSFVGATVSNSVTGLFINAYRFAIPYWLALGCLLASFLYVVFVLPESLPEVLRRRDLTLQASFTSYPKSVWRVLTRARPNRWKISLGIPGTLFMNMLIMGIGPLVTLYLLNKPFCYSAINVGYYLGGRFFITGLGMGLGLKVLSLFLSDFIIIFTGFASFIISYTVLAFAKDLLFLCIGKVSFEAIFGGGSITACGTLLFSGVPGPIFRGILSRTVDSDEQGALFSAIASLEMIFVFIGSSVFGTAYPFFNKLNFAGATFLIADVVLIAPIICTIVYTARITHERRSHKNGVLKVIAEDSEVENLTSPVSNYGSDGSTTPLLSAEEKANEALNKDQ